MSEKNGGLRAAADRLGDMFRDAFSAAASPATASAAPAIANTCDALASQIEQQGGQVKAGQQRQAIACGLGGT